MNSASLARPLTPKRRFFPLHLKLMLSYLVLAGAIVAVSSAFAWREANDTRARESLARVDASYRQVKQEFDRRLERALAVVNLAAVTPELTKEIIARGTVELGPDSQSTLATGLSYNATAQFIADPVEFYKSLGLEAGLDHSVSGAAVINGSPQAVALAPVSSSSGIIGVIFVSVEADSVPGALQSEIDKAFWATADSAGGWQVGPGAVGGEITPLTPRDANQLSGGKVVETLHLGSTPLRTVYFPLPSLSKQTVAALAIEGPASESGSSSPTNPLLGLAVFTISIGLFVAHFLARTVSRPVEQITEATERIAAGDIAYQLPQQKGRDELSVLHDSFNRMTQKYYRSQGEVEAAAARLKQTVAAQDVEIQTLFGISRAITSILDLNSLLEQVLKLTMPLIKSQRGVVWINSRKGKAAAAPGRRQKLDLPPAIVFGGPPHQVPPAISEDHPLLTDLSKRHWQVAVQLPSQTGSEGKRQLFFATGEPATPYQVSEEALPNSLWLPEGLSSQARTQVIVPVLGQKGFAQGILVMTIAGRRPLTRHEALLIFNIVGLASVAVENAELYSLAQRRGEQIATLLRESHHRITNNLAAITGVLSIQAAQARAPELAAIIQDNIARINSIAHVHRLLSGEMKDRVEIADMIRSIASPTVSATGGSDIRLAVAGTPQVLPAKKATSVALIINELVINSLKHGFAGRSQGNILVSIASRDGQLYLNYQDDGAGLDSKPAAAHEGLGTRIINSLVRDDLRGDWSFHSDPRGYHAQIHFPLD